MSSWSGDLIWSNGHSRACGVDDIPRSDPWISFEGLTKDLKILLFEFALSSLAEVIYPISTHTASIAWRRVEWATVLLVYSSWNILRRRSPEGPGHEDVVSRVLKWVEPCPKGKVPPQLAYFSNYLKRKTRARLNFVSDLQFLECVTSHKQSPPSFP